MGVEFERIWLVLVQITEYGFFPAAKGVIGQRYRDWYVDVDYVDIDLVGEIVRGVVVVGKDCGAIVIFMVYCQTQGFFIVLGAHDG